MGDLFQYFASQLKLSGVLSPSCSGWPSKGDVINKLVSQLSCSILIVKASQHIVSEQQHIVLSGISMKS